jgi:hypothetical protein
MIDPQTATIGILWGCVLISLGFVPGLSQRLTQGVAEEIRNFEERLFTHRSWAVPCYTGDHTRQRPLWLAGLGLALIILSVVAALTG